MRNSNAVLMACAFGVIACGQSSNAPFSNAAAGSGNAGDAGSSAFAGGGSGGVSGTAGASDAANGGTPSLAGSPATAGFSGEGTAGNGGLAGSGTAGRGGSPSEVAGDSGFSGASAGSGGAAPLPPLKITSDTGSIEFTPLLVAAENLYAGKATVGSGGIVTLLTDTTVDLGSNAETQSLRQSVDHPNLRIIFTVTETFYRIVSSRAAGVTKLAELKGKSIATIPNTSAAYYIDKMLRTVNLTDKDVTIRSGTADTLPTLLANGTVSAVTLWEPSPQVAMDRIGGDAIEFQDRSVYREIVSLHSTAETLANPEKRRGIVAFVRSLVEAQRQFREQAETVKPRVAKALSMDAALLDKVWHNEQWLGTLVPDLLGVLVEEEVWVAAQTNRTPRSRAQLTPLVDDSIMKEALGK